MTLLIPRSILADAGAFFERRGEEGCEGTALLAGSSDGAVTRLVIPDQRATPAPRASVTITEDGELELAIALNPDERYLSRIHSHPQRAFHSPADDANPVLTHQGALSIVVPWFGLGLRRGLNACAVLVYADDAWTDLPPGSTRDARVREV
jgi:hypothetical protein